ncbi:hypothetical protein Csac_2655 [Caldicellulosiruptor saccharolyticus DSM 8903]|uniref:Uncharacterized protein n=1 Tax=Caldicellulosiruptor saccharolyticus (strain ATCC 43494 / DSM 8903 / Tp8T 6331) TaxID=351627 RepID=A4XMU1_CALS8|nr:hypothetical protein [Caldicellulosiruptor saccharolyticus]ABP68226.2 hypothetical protein Csac_2655 [Caldicellulosiruptor saccharolyticus DSM 8903]
MKSKKITMTFEEEEINLLLAFFTITLKNSPVDDAEIQQIISKIAKAAETELVFENGKIKYAKRNGNVFYQSSL